jgi:hypothetical protein
MNEGTSYAPGLNLTALEASPFTWGDGALANASGTSANASGSDSAAIVQTALNTPPETAPKYGVKTAFSDIWDTFFGSGPIVETPKAAAERKKIESEQSLLERYPLLWSVLLVVVGIMLLSRGFGLLGEEGENVVVNLSDKNKYPGIAHAIHGLKGKAKSAALAAAE